MKDIEQIITRQEEEFYKTFGLTVRTDDFYRNMYYSLKGKDILDWHLSSIKEILEGVKQKISKLKNIDTMTDYDVGYNDCKSDTINHLEEIIKKL